MHETRSRDRKGHQRSLLWYGLVACAFSEDVFEAEPLNRRVLASKEHCLRPKVPRQAEDVARIGVKVRVENI